MKKKNNEFGFSMAELLMVVAILVALFGVAFVAVQRHQRSMTQLEYDTIAKEIFVAAQNHLTAAESQGYLGKITDESGYGNKSEFKDAKSSDEDDEVYFFTVTKGTAGQGVMLDLMLPFGAIDETIRAGGSYIIRYQPSTARVLDVFYSNPGPVTAWLTLTGADLKEDHYADLMSLRGEENKAARRKCDIIGGAVVGWYGDGDALPVGDRLEAPQVLIHNEETLWVEVKNPTNKTTNTNITEGSLALIVTGETSEAKKAFYLNKDTTDLRIPEVSEVPEEYIIYKIILDDITTEGLHFAEIVADTSEQFIPGENITVEAVAYNNSALTNIAYSGKGRTNSIFADPSSYEVKPQSDMASTELNKVNGTVVYKDNTTNPIGIAAVANFRHLENLDKYVSGWGKGEALEYISAVQLTNLTDDLSWTKFIGGDTTSGDRVCAEGKSSVTGYTGTNKYWPVNLEKGFLYDGRGHSISDVVTDGSAPGEDKNVGLFRTLNGCTVRNLELIDFAVQGTVNAGALAGAISDSAGANTSVSNVLVRNSAEKDSSFSDIKNNKNNIIADASAGGLIGSMSGGSVTGCAAAVYVSGGTNAGGLIGKAVRGTVTTCYSGGHTDGADTGTATYFEGGKPEYVNNELTNGIYNVVSESGTAGGLIGDAGSAEIIYSYSTCSAKGGTNVGGLIGTGNGSVTRCYATGLVNGGSEAATGAFAGDFTGTISTEVGEESYYFQIINEIHNADKTISYLPPLGKATESKDVKALDETVDSYDKFVGAPTSSTENGKIWKKTVPFDKDLETFYQGLYPLRTVIQLGASLPAAEQGQPDWFIKTHYGDWPAPEIFVINK